MPGDEQEKIAPLMRPVIDNLEQLLDSDEGKRYENELLLIVVNFDNMPVNVGVNIPLHAFEYLHLPHLSHAQATDLLSGKTETINLLPDKPAETSIEGYSGKILKVTWK